MVATCRDGDTEEAQDGRGRESAPPGPPARPPPLPSPAPLPPPRSRLSPSRPTDTAAAIVGGFSHKQHLWQPHKVSKLSLQSARMAANLGQQALFGAAAHTSSGTNSQALAGKAGRHLWEHEPLASAAADQQHIDPIHAGLRRGHAYRYAPAGAQQCNQSRTSRLSSFGKRKSGSWPPECNRASNCIDSHRDQRRFAQQL